MEHKLCYCAHQFNKPLSLPPRNKCLERSSIEHSYYVTCAWNDIIDCIDAFLARGENIFCWPMKLQCLHSKTSKFSPIWVKVYVACLIERFSRLVMVVGNGVCWQRKCVVSLSTELRNQVIDLARLEVLLSKHISLIGQQHMSE